MSDENNILNQSGNESCPDQHMLSKYIMGELNDIESEAFLTHLSDCEFCKEAVAGYAGLQNKGQIPFIIDELNQQIDSKVSIGRSVIPLYRTNFFRIAAVLVVLVVSVFFLTKFAKNPDVEIAEAVLEEEISKDNESPVDEKTETAETNENIREEKQIAQASPELMIVEEDIEESLDIELDLADVKEEETEENSVEGNSELFAAELNPSGLFDPESEDEPLAVENLQGIAVEIKKERNKGYSRKATSKAAGKDVQLKGKYDIEGYSDIPVDSMAVSHEFFIDGMNYYNTGDYSNSGIYLSNAFLWDSSNTDAACYTGVSNFNLKNYEEAIPYFDEVLNRINDPCFFQAKWFKAKSYIELSKKEEATLLLEELSNTENMYSEEAKVLLESLKK